MTSIDFIYSHILAPLLIGAFHIGALANEKIRRGLLLRAPDAEGRDPWCRGPSGSRPIWIHCASGEFEYAKPVIQEIKRRDPQQTILVTYFSPSIRDAVAKFPGVDLHSPAPWDRKTDIGALIEHHHPRALVIARTDTWPTMLAETNRRGLPSLLFSATLVASAGRLHPFIRPLSRWILSHLTTIYCVTEEDRVNFSSLGVEDRVRVAGDTRFDQVIARLRAPKPITPLFDAETASRVLVAGSTWEEDEAQLTPVMVHMKGRMKFVIAPHEPTEEHLTALETRLRAADLRFARYSTLEFAAHPKLNIDVVVVDRVGILAELYQLAEFAFVGGSFRKTVHSVMEPLAAGCMTFVGPLHTNNREAIEFATITLPQNKNSTRELCAVVPVTDSDDWVSRLEEALAADTEEIQRRKVFIRGEIEKRAGRSQMVADWVFKNRL